MVIFTCISKSSLCVFVINLFCTYENNFGGLVIKYKSLIQGALANAILTLIQGVLFETLDFWRFERDVTLQAISSES